MKTGVKKVTAIVTMVVMLIGVLGGCGLKNVTKNENNVYLNNEYADKGMVNIDGSKYSYDKDNSIMERSTGIGIEYKIDHIKSLAKNEVLNYAFLGEEGKAYGVFLLFMQRKQVS